MAYLVLMGFNILLSMVVQQRVAILEFSQEKMSARPTSPSCYWWLAYCSPNRLVLFFQDNKVFFFNLLFEKNQFFQYSEGQGNLVCCSLRGCTESDGVADNNGKGISTSLLSSRLPAMNAEISVSLGDNPQ